MLWISQPVSGGTLVAIQQVALSSTALSSASYDDESETLEITFQNGRTYTYDGVPSEVFTALRDARSPGTYFLQNIKDRY